MSSPLAQSLYDPKVEQIIRQQVADNYVSFLQNKVQVFLKEYQASIPENNYIPALADQATILHKVIEQLQNEIVNNQSVPYIPNKTLIKEKLDGYKTAIEAARADLRGRIRPAR